MKNKPVDKMIKSSYKELRLTRRTIELGPYDNKHFLRMKIIF